MSNEIWVFIEKSPADDGIAAISRELLGKGRALADSAGVALAALVLGSGVTCVASGAATVSGAGSFASRAMRLRVVPLTAAKACINKRCMVFQGK